MTAREDQPQLGTCETTDWPHLTSDGRGEKRPHEERWSCTKWMPIAPEDQPRPTPPENKHILGMEPVSVLRQLIRNYFAGQKPDRAIGVDDIVAVAMEFNRWLVSTNKTLQKVVMDKINTTLPVPILIERVETGAHPSQDTQAAEQWMRENKAILPGPLTDGDWDQIRNLLAKYAGARSTPSLPQNSQELEMLPEGEHTAHGHPHSYSICSEGDDGHKCIALAFGETDEEAASRARRIIAGYYGGGRSTQGELHDTKAGSDAISSHDCSSTERRDANHPHGADPSSVPLRGTPSLPAQDARSLTILGGSEMSCPTCGRDDNAPVIEAGGWSTCSDNFHSLQDAPGGTISVPGYDGPTTTVKLQTVSSFDSGEIMLAGGSTPSPDPPHEKKFFSAEDL